MSAKVLLHVLVLGLWGGCVAAEMVMEVAASRDASLRPALARFHELIDRFVELPLLLAVLATGAALLRGAPLTGLLALKVALGLGAVGANLWCLVPVIRRRAAAERGDDAEVERRSRQVIGAFVVGFPCGLGALALGLRLGGFA